MAGLIYLAGPIDLVRDAPPGKIDLMKLRSSACAQIIDRGCAVFDPSTAYMNAGAEGAAKSVKGISDAAVLASWGVLALLPPGVPSIGTPMEIQLAVDHGISVAVVGGNGSMQLKAMPIEVVPLKGEGILEIDEALGWLMAHGPDPSDLETTEWASSGFRPILKWTGDPAYQPQRTYEGDAGFDLIVSEDVRIPVDGFADVPMGICVEMPPGVWGLVIGRSSTVRTRGLLVTQGVIDNGYRGPMFAGVKNLGDGPVEVKRGERIAQLLPFPQTSANMETLRVGTLSESDRGERGFGSTGS